MMKQQGHEKKQPRRKVISFLDSLMMMVAAPALEAAAAASTASSFTNLLSSRHLPPINCSALTHISIDRVYDGNSHSERNEVTNPTTVIESQCLLAFL